MTSTLLSSFFFALLLTPAAPFSATCVSVIDGDTVEVLHRTEKIRIRVEGIDCPENGQAFDSRATAFTAEFAKGKTVSVVPKEIDKYGRTVARILVDEKDLSVAIVRAGLAWHFKQYSSDWMLDVLEHQARSEHTRALDSAECDRTLGLSACQAGHSRGTRTGSDAGKTSSGRDYKTCRETAGQQHGHVLRQHQKPCFPSELMPLRWLQELHAELLIAG